MFNLQPGTGLGRPASKEIAFGLGDWQYITEFFDRLEIFHRWRGNYIVMELGTNFIEFDLITAEELIIFELRDTPRIGFDTLKTRQIEFRLITDKDIT